MRNIFKFGLLTVLLGVALSASAQTAAFNYFCQDGGIKALTSGLPSTNTFQASYPQCQVNVYLTGTVTRATIYKDSISTPLANPFTANLNGSWLFYAATGQGYDVTMNGGSPIALPSPVTLTDLIVSAGGGGSGCSATGPNGQFQMSNGSGGCTAAPADIGVTAPQTITYSPASLGIDSPKITIVSVGGQNAYVAPVPLTAITNAFGIGATVITGDFSTVGGASNGLAGLGLFVTGFTATQGSLLCNNNDSGFEEYFIVSSTATEIHTTHSDFSCPSETGASATGLIAADLGIGGLAGSGAAPNVTSLVANRFINIFTGYTGSGSDNERINIDTSGVMRINGNTEVSLSTSGQGFFNSDAGAYVGSADAGINIEGTVSYTPWFITHAASPYSVGNNQELYDFYDATAGNIITNLPSLTAGINSDNLPGAQGTMYYLKKIDSSGGTVTINAFSGDTFEDGTTSQTLTAQNQYIILVAGACINSGCTSSPRKNVWSIFGQSGSAGGVTSINTVAGPFTFNFSSGAGSCSGTTCTFTGSGSGGGSVTNFIANSGSWPSWLVPSVATSTTTPTLSVAASAIPNSALATQTANTVLGALTATTPSGLAMPSCSGGSNALIWTSGTGFGCNTISAGSSAFNAITSGTNTTAAMVVGAGATLNFTSSGTINASSVGGVALSGLCQTGGAGCPAGGSSAWSAITNPTGNLALNMAANTSTFTYGSTTGSSDLFALTDTASNTGTGIMFHAFTASGSTEIPWQADANGNGWQVGTDGSLKSVGSTTHGITIPAGPAVGGVAGSVVISSDTTTGFLEANENATGKSRVCTAANAVCGGGTGTLVASAEVVSFSATPTFSISFNMSRIVLTNNITSFTLGAGADGQLKVLCFEQGSGPYTVTPPANVHGFFTIGVTNATWNCQGFAYDLTDSIWLSTTPGVVNQ